MFFFTSSLALALYVGEGTKSFSSKEYQIAWYKRTRQRFASHGSFHFVRVRICKPFRDPIPCLAESIPGLLTRFKYGLSWMCL
jgi:hypothetical protein